MTVFDITTARRICDSCLEIGQVLDNDQIVNASRRAVRQLDRSGKTTLAFVSENQKALNQLSQQLFDTRLWNDSDLVVNRPFMMRLSFAETPAAPDYSRLAQQGDAIRLDYGANSSALENLDVLFIDTEGDYTAFDWRKELESVDYLFMALSASRLLPRDERSFMEHEVQSYFGFGRTCCIVTGLNALTSLQMLEDVKNRLRWYLDSLSPSPSYYMEDDGQLKDFVTSELTARMDEFLPMAWQQSASLCLQDTEAALQEMMEKTEMDVNALKEQIEVLKAREGDLRKRGILRGNEFYNAFNGRIIYDAVTSMRKYINQMYESICKRLDTGVELEETVEFIPDYMQSAMDQLRRELEKQMTIDMDQLHEQMQRQMEKDAGEFFTDISSTVIEEVYREKIDAFNVGGSLEDIFEEMKQQASDEKAKNLSSILLAASVPVLIFTNLPLAIGTVIASQVVKRMSFGETKPDMERIKAAVQDYCHNLAYSTEEEIKKAGERNGKKAEKQIADAYAAFISKVLDTLARLIDEAEAASKVRDRLQAYCSTELPRLKAMLNT